MQRMVREAVLAYGGVDILVASAGLATSAPVTETSVGSACRASEYVPSVSRCETTLSAITTEPRRSFVRASPKSRS